MKWIFLIAIVALGYALYNGYMGGARDATQNYNKLLTGKPATGESEGKSPLENKQP